MRVFITGASGWVGTAVTRELLEAGHTVVGLVRTEDKARALVALGGAALSGSLADLEVLAAGAAGADGVIHLAFGAGLGDPAAFARSAQEDRQAIETFGAVYAGSARPIVVTAGIGVLPPGERFTEAMPSRPPHPSFPRISEPVTLEVAARGVAATTVRLPRSVHGAGETHGFVPRLMALARRTGRSAYVGDGGNVWPSVHRLDAARLFRLALEAGARGGPFHAVADEGVPFRRIAEAIGQRLALPVASIPPDQAAAHFGPMAMPVMGNGPASSAQTQARLGWVPREPGLIEDIERHYVG